ncbi:DUF805 domain-containing protein [Pseudomonas sp. Fl5BN2]|uniref:DUF805 domain-containing protein n=1 Tax=unclassified Pseudomonas TaxID=196821 RepID=UPI001378F70D|nr:DUF805 domain-containing protein [Pseudomonas sp. Fl5BN2]NBF07074.1 DUF805 domain-containing protein [Pseudomonas sp. Fl4BN1]
MVFCRGCAKEIHSSALSCPQCGAQQAIQNIAPSTPAVTGNWYVEVLKKYAVFTGRARRKEYWMFFLINFLIALGIGFIEGFFGGKGLLSNLYSLAVFLPSLAVAVRRMHDTDHSGWWILLPFVNLYFLVKDGQPGDNRFGPNPKAIA